MLARPVARSQRVTRDNPCPVCGKPDWCLFTSDGNFVCCQRCPDWSGVPAIRQTDAGWLFALGEGDTRAPVLHAGATTEARIPSLTRAASDGVYRRLAALLPLREEARGDLIERRAFPVALSGDALYFSLPRSGTENAAVSEQLIAEFGLDLVQRVPGFTSLCRRCDGYGTAASRACNTCDGLGRLRPRFRSVRGERHDYAVIACDEDGLAFWGFSRRLPFDPVAGSPKYMLLSSSRAGEPSLSGLPKYHVAGRQYPAEEIVFTEGIIKAEIAAWKLQQRVVALFSTSVDGSTLGELERLLVEWESKKALIAFDSDKHLPKHEGVLRGEVALVEAFSSSVEVSTAEWNPAGGKGIDDLLVNGGTFRRLRQQFEPVLRPRVPRPCPEPGPVDEGPSLAEVELATRTRIGRRFTLAYRNTIGLIAPPPGCAKTGSVLRQCEIAPLDVLVAVARHEQGEELVERAAREHCRCGSPRGNCNEHRLVLHHDYGRNATNCLKIELVEVAQESGYGKFTNEAICGSLRAPICEHRMECSYHRQFSREGSHVAALETVLNRPTGIGATKNVFLDDVDSARLIAQTQVTAATIARALAAPRGAAVRPLVLVLQAALEHAPGESLHHDKAYDCLDDAARRLGTSLERVLSETAPAPAMLPVDNVEAYRAAPPGQIVDLIALLHEEYPWYRSGQPFTSGLRIHHGAIDFAVLHLPARDNLGRTAFSGRAVAVLSATPDPILRRWMSQLNGRVVSEYDPRLALPSRLRVVQDVAAFYGKGALVGRDLTVPLARAAAYLREFQPRRPSVITFKGICDQVSAELGIPRERVLHFGNQRGSNALRDADLLLIIGTPGMSPDAAYWYACAAFRGPGETLSSQRAMKRLRYGGWHDDRGWGRDVEVGTFADARVAEILETSRRDELRQAVFRVRPFDLGKPADDRGTATVILMTEFPVDGLRVDELRFSGNAAEHERTFERLLEAAGQLTAEGIEVTSRQLAKLTGVRIERAQEHIREVSALRSPPSINKTLIEGGDQAAETWPLPFGDAETSPCGSAAGVVVSGDAVGVYCAACAVRGSAR